MDSKNKKHEPVERLVVPLWPDAGMALGLGKNRTYLSAKDGEIPVLTFGRAKRVPLAWLRRVTSGEA